MKLLTKSIEKKLPALYAQDGKGDEAMVYVKFFCPWGYATWYATEYDPDTRTFFGYCCVLPGGEELGYFSLDELESISGPGGLGIERDKYFSPTKLGEIKEGKQLDENLEKSGK